MASTRDNFYQMARNILAGRVGYRCSICGALTIGPKEGSIEVHNMGIAAHITAAAENGPRYDKDLNPAQRRNYKNGIWCCLRCGKIVDNDLHRWTIDQLLRYKMEAERLAGKKIGIESMHDFPPRLELESACAAEKCQLPGYHYEIEAKIGLRNAGGDDARNIVMKIHFGNYFKWYPFTADGWEEHSLQRVQRGKDSKNGFEFFQDNVRTLPADMDMTVWFMRAKASLTLDDVKKQDQIKYKIHCTDAAPLEGTIDVDFFELIDRAPIIKPDDLRAKLNSERGQ